MCVYIACIYLQLCFEADYSRWLPGLDWIGAVGGIGLGFSFCAT